MQTPVRTNDLLNALHHITLPSSGPELAKGFPGMLLRRNAAAEQRLMDPDDGVPSQETASAEGAASGPRIEGDTASRAEAGFLAGDDYYVAKEQLITDEQILLRILGFELNVASPHKYILNLCRLLRCSRPLIQLAICLVRTPIQLTISLMSRS